MVTDTTVDHHAYNNHLLIMPFVRAAALALLASSLVAADPIPLPSGLADPWPTAVGSYTGQIHVWYGAEDNTCLDSTGQWIEAKSTCSGCVCDTFKIQALGASGDGWYDMKISNSKSQPCYVNLDSTGNFEALQCNGKNKVVAAETHWNVQPSSDPTRMVPSLSQFRRKSGY